METCHYWMQMLNGPRIMPAGTGTLFGWEEPLFAIWYVWKMYSISSGMIMSLSGSLLQIRMKRF
jgi:hypothetical protein